VKQDLLINKINRIGGGIKNKQRLKNSLYVNRTMMKH